MFILYPSRLKFELAENMKFNFHGVEKYFPTDIYFNFARKVTAVGSFIATVLVFSQIENLQSASKQAEK